MDISTPKKLKIRMQNAMIKPVLIYACNTKQCPINIERFERCDHWMNTMNVMF